VSPPEQPSPSCEELAGLVVELTSQLEWAHARIAELEARLGRDSTNSSQPPSHDSIAAKAKRRADRSSRERSPHDDLAVSTLSCENAVTDRSFG